MLPVHRSTRAGYQAEAGPRGPLHIGVPCSTCGLGRLAGQWRVELMAAARRRGRDERGDSAGGSAASEHDDDDDDDDDRMCFLLRVCLRFESQDLCRVRRNA